MSKIGIITDSTCDLPMKLIKKHDIEIIPVNVIFNNEEVRQPIFDLTNEEFYRRLEAGEEITSGVSSPKIFKEHIDKHLEKYDEIILITLSSKLSAVNQTANLVVKQFAYENVTVIDSLSGTIETGLVVLLAARQLAAGKTKLEVIKYLEE